jgi:acyl-coenzyme A thioesterase PaaI-like protein
MATGRTVRVGKTVSVADVEVRDATGALVAVGRACYASPRSPTESARPKEETR